MNSYHRLVFNSLVALCVVLIPWCVLSYMGADEDPPQDPPPLTVVEEMTFRTAEDLVLEIEEPKTLPLRRKRCRCDEKATVLDLIERQGKILDDLIESEETEYQKPKE